MSYVISLATMAVVFLMAHFGVDQRASLALFVYATLVMVILEIRKK